MFEWGVYTPCFGNHLQYIPNHLITWTHILSLSRAPNIAAGKHTMRSMRVTKTMSAPYQTLIIVSLTRSLLHRCLSGPCVLFRTINLVLFTLVKITHPDTCWEGLMIVPVERLLWSTKVDGSQLMLWLLAHGIFLHFSSHTFGLCVSFPFVYRFLFFRQLFFSDVQAGQSHYPVTHVGYNNSSCLHLSRSIEILLHAVKMLFSCSSFFCSSFHTVSFQFFFIVLLHSPSSR